MIKAILIKKHRINFLKFDAKLLITNIENYIIIILIL